MPLDGKPYTIPHLKALISGLNVSISQVRSSFLIGPTLFRKLPVLHHREAKSRFVLLFAVYQAQAYHVRMHEEKLGEVSYICFNC